MLPALCACLYKTSAKANFGNLGLQDKKQACSRLSVQISFQKTTTTTAAARTTDAAQRANITKKVHKPPRNHYIEWPYFLTSA